ncbi:MAG: SidA/IucD/PvdA family monooxygenase [Pseudomonadota bacterium]|nr:SidA/IucD/PvdA family monooxygenase [Pseudomonadota bacterium]
MNHSHLSLAGIGAGPFNLSVAALLQRVPRLPHAFFEQKPAFNWHPGLMLRGARLQTSWLKDLVTPVDPTSPYSFLQFLVEHGRFYAFLNAEQPAVSRQEFAQYLAWVAQRLPTLTFSAQVREIDHRRDRFQLRFDDRTVTADHLCLGTGTQPYVPDFAVQHLGKQVLHGAHILNAPRQFHGKRVAVIGGGQTGAEIFLELIGERWGECDSVAWISRRDNFEPLDEAPFTNDLFTPAYVQHFLSLSREQKQTLVARQKLASDGISPSTLVDIYQSLYEIQMVQGRNKDYALMPGRQLVQMQRHGDHYRLQVQHHRQAEEWLEADVVIFCTGFKSVVPACLEPLVDRIHWQEDGCLAMQDNYRIRWQGSERNRIYAVNASRHHHGIVDPQTSLMAWRGANIVNDLLGQPLYQLEQAGMVQWGVREPDKVRVVA